jgi:tetratricopeptide (TPR) repeat protein
VTSATSSASGSAAQAAALKPKDIATIIVSSIALIVSIFGAFYTVTSKRSETERTARSDFAAIVESLVDLRQTQETLRRELGDEWGSYNTFQMRVNLSDKQRLLISRAVYLLTNYQVDASDMQYVTIGASLADDGRYGESLEYYEKALAVSPTPLTRAASRRVYGRTFDTGRRLGGRSSSNALVGEGL